MFSSDPAHGFQPLDHAEFVIGKSASIHQSFDFTHDDAEPSGGRPHAAAITSSPVSGSLAASTFARARPARALLRFPAAGPPPRQA